MKFIHYKIYVLCIALTTFSFASNVVQAQTRRVMNRPYIDQRRFHYGFLAGLNLQDIELQQNGYKDANGNQWFAEAPNFEPGFSVGILGEFFLTKHLALRVIPTMHFGTKNMTYRNTKNNDRQYQSIKSTYISLPIDIKFSAERFNNYRPYAMVGVNPMLDLTVKRQQQLLLKNFYWPWFKFIPEIKFCYGLLNIIDKNRDDMTDASQLIFSESIDKGRSKMIVFTLYFE